MSDAPTSAISPLLIIIVIFVVVIIFFTLSSDTQDQVFSIFDEAFFGDEKNKEAAQLTTLETQKSFLSSISECKSGVTVNPNAKSECFCYTGKFGVISDKSYFSIQNGLNVLTLTSFTENSAPIGGSTEEYNLGFVVLKDNGYNQEKNGFDWEIGCVFPELFWIKGVNEGGEWYKNLPFMEGSARSKHWYFRWKDPLVAKSWYQSGDFSEFQLYREKSDLEYPEMASAPVLYKVSDTQYCIVTDLVEEPLIISNFYNYKTIASSDVGDAQLSPNSLSSIFKDAKPFFIDSSRYCNKQ